MGLSGNPTGSVDIIGAFRFAVEIDGLLVGGFTEISGLEAETEYDEYQEGGLNTFVHRFPKVTKFPPLVFKRGITTSSTLWDWYHDAVGGTVKRKTGAIILYNIQGREVCRWNFEGAYPTKWSGPALSSTSNDVAIESIELAHTGLKALFKK
jgi:phage tail-like protein